MDTPSGGINLKEVEKALDTLLDREPSENTFLLPGQPIPSSVASKQGPETLISEAKLTVLRFEEDLWRVFGMRGAFVLDELLKQCQRTLLEAAKTGTAHTPETESVRQELGLLDRIHRSQKDTSLLYIRAHTIGTWKSFIAEDPSKFRQDRKQDFGRRFWALIIGNNNYLENPLSGCINDGTLIQSYLIEYLGVPPTQIRFLQNATRKQMIDALYDLRDNNDIIRNDNILIHYSGCGTSYPAADYFQTLPAKAGSIDAICPVDRGLSVPDISDRELVSILYELQREKGDNVTLILDCCNSGGTLRSIVSPEEGTIRYLVPLSTTEQKSTLSALLTAADNNLRRRPDTLLTSSENWIADVEGLVQLVACQDLQVAREGIFPMEFHSMSAEATGDNVPRGSLLVNVKNPPKPLAPDSKFSPGYDPKRTSSFPFPHPPSPRRYGYFTWALVSAFKSKVGRTGTYEDVIKTIGHLGYMQDPITVGRCKRSMLWYTDEK